MSDLCECPSCRIEDVEAERDYLKARLADVEMALDQWGHDVDCARRMKRFRAGPSEACDCSLEHLNLHALDAAGLEP